MMSRSLTIRLLPSASRARLIPNVSRILSFWTAQTCPDQGFRALVPGGLRPLRRSALFVDFRDQPTSWTPEMRQYTIQRVGARLCRCVHQARRSRQRGGGNKKQSPCAVGVVSLHCGLVNVVDSHALSLRSHTTICLCTGVSATIGLLPRDIGLRHSEEQLLVILQGKATVMVREVRCSSRVCAMLRQLSSP